MPGPTPQQMAVTYPTIFASAQDVYKVHHTIYERSTRHKEYRTHLAEALSL